MGGAFCIVLLYFVSYSGGEHCGPNQVYKRDSCDLTCRNIGKPQPCSRRCKTCRVQCHCKPGFYRNDDNNCVRPYLCQQGHRCGLNEIYKTVQYNKRTCDNMYPIKAAGIIKSPGCYCEAGFVRNMVSGECIHPKHCPGICKPGEIYTSFKRSQKTCQNRFNRNRVVEKEMNPGCRCQNGFIRNELDGRCILEKDCPPPKCATNETYQLTSRNCGVCSNYNIRMICPLIKKPGCYCSPGYVRNRATGNCVLYDDCPQRCKDRNAEYSLCPKRCSITCQHPVKRKFCFKPCIPGCQCKKGFIFNELTKRCVPQASCINECTALQNEELVQCVPTSPTTCQNRFLAPKPYSLLCKAGCTCKTGFIRDEFTNKCIPEKNCPACSNPNETFNRCTDVTGRTCQKKKNCDLACPRGCCCIEGMIRDEISGNCVPESECPERIECKENMYFEDCKNVPNGVKCVQRCVCNSGYIFDDVVEECLPIEESEDTCSDPNAYYSRCGSACPRSCSNMWNPQMCIAMCKKGCFCKEDYVLNSNGTCVLEQDCEAHEIVCPPNQHLDESENEKSCICNDEYFYDDESDSCVPEACRDCPDNATCNHCGKGYVKTCENLIIPGVANDSCSPRCECNEGYVFNDEGDCVPIKTCKPSNVKCPEHSKFSTCGAFCPKTCSNLMMQIKCIDVCIMGCICDKGYVLNKENKCVKEDECKIEEIICPSNQHYNATQKKCICDKDFVLDNETSSCVPKPKCGICPENSICNSKGKGCVKTCLNLVVPETCNITNQTRCECKEGYVFNKQKMCVPIGSCKPNEVKCPNTDSTFSNCTSACPKTCSNMYLNESCVATCVVGCKCRQGHVFNQAKFCVRPIECETHEIKCPPNQHFQDIYVKDVRKRGCACNAGYHFDNSTNTCKESTKCGKCPLLSHCNHESYGCPKTCKTIGNWKNCKIKPGPRCECEKGFVFNEKGECEPISKCDLKKVKCSDPNAVFSTCGPSCPERCATMYLNKQCDRKCNLGCVCKPGFVLNSKEICVKDLECLPEEIKCPGEQHFQDFVVNGMRIRGCICKAGYFLDNATSTCVTSHKCGKCPENSFCNECANGCRKTCGNLLTAKKCNESCVARCECHDGFVFNKENICVPIGNCPRTEVKCPDVNAVLSPCPSTCPRRCLNIYIGEATGMECNMLCECKPGYLLNSKGACVLEKHCMPSEIRCPRHESVDRNKCVCETGFAFNSNNSCTEIDGNYFITRILLNKVCGEHQEYRCGSACTKDCDNLHLQMKCAPGCRDGCFCKEGFVYENRNSDECVPIESCYSYCKADEFEIYHDENYCGCIEGDVNNCSLCRPGCHCMESFVRNSAGKCIEVFI